MTTNITVNSLDVRARLRQLAMPFLFFLLGVLYASWAARIPAIRDRLALDAATLSMVLLCSGIGAVCSFPLAAWLNAHYGARHTASYAGWALLLVLPCLGAATNLPLLMLGCFCYGSAASCFDVAINALGAEHEKQVGRSIMSMLHAWFCVGTFSGALLGSAMASVEIAPWQHFLVLSLLFALPLKLSYQRLPNDRPHHDPQRKVFAIPHGHLVALGLIVFCGAIVEGSISNWSGIYMKDHMHAGDGAAPLSYAGFAGMMLVARMLGDRLKERWGARSIVGYGALLAAFGIAIVVLAPSIVVAAIGFMITGAGVAMVFPFVFSAAGRHGAIALAGVATLGYSGSLIGPPVVGILAQGFGLQAALSFIGVLCVAVAFAASRARWLV
ncbi:MFS family permease [Herbaspirillum sp. Sphag1AN]|uniref:MFS transporter n=1 Tax=unclassified Herbaspirillum TaxID=2624150 RepID=UPI001610AB01|nr:MULTISPECIES: MFS transporter [unclassified Herbaspirillum]MBB3213622.1 MFS family permease [Herbaspirillum sp. Sphag1AN]MBB3246820.1 MFS family permease [Herbaspirillum sp. Sphag64]